MTDFRTETDSLGPKQLPREAVWGVHTAAGGRELPDHRACRSRHFPELVRALALVKQAAARANRELGAARRRARRGDRRAPATRSSRGALHDQFVVDVIQGGAGTSTNMNANEVIANRALELAGPREGRLRAPAPERPRQHVAVAPTTSIRPRCKLALHLRHRDRCRGDGSELRGRVRAPRRAEFARRPQDRAAPSCRTPCR